VANDGVTTYQSNAQVSCVNQCNDVHHVPSVQSSVTAMPSPLRVTYVRTQEHVTDYLLHTSDDDDRYTNQGTLHATWRTARWLMDCWVVVVGSGIRICVAAR
jgi:hypothetical protein